MNLEEICSFPKKTQKAQGRGTPNPWDIPGVRCTSPLGLLSFFRKRANLFKIHIALTDSIIITDNPRIIMRFAFGAWYEYVSRGWCSESESVRSTCACL